MRWAGIRFRRWLESLFVLCTLGLCTAHPIRAEVKEARVPVLVVSPDVDHRYKGNLIYFTIELIRRKADQPLAVAVTEDQPSGVGDQMRASLWLAATTVALERNEPLNGLKIDVTTHGAVDGPSAGAMLTLAIMSMLDNRKLPDDMAFTGTILPDGSVGQVGGVVQKIRAAAAAGKKRVFLPPFNRVMKDLNSDEWVDLKALCHSLGLEYVPVSNIREAYAGIYGLEAPTVREATLKLSEEMEGLLTEFYHQDLEAGDKIAHSLHLKASETLEALPAPASARNIRAKAERAFRAGHIPDAYESAHAYRKMLMTFQGEERAFSDYAATEFNVAIPAVAKALKTRQGTLLKDVLETFALNAKTGRPMASEWDSTLRDVSDYWALVASLDDQAQALIKRSSQEGETTEIQSRFFFNRLLELAAANGTAESERQIGNFLKLCQAYPISHRSAGARHSAVEQLVYTAFNAADGNYVATVVKPYADGKRMSLEAAADHLAESDSAYAAYRIEAILGGAFHKAVLGSEDLYMVAEVAQFQGAALAASSAQTLRAELEASSKAGVTGSIENVYLLHSLLDSARHEAVTAIARCQANKLPCWRPVEQINIADAKRDDKDEDKVDLLRRYYEAAIQAKILSLLFSS